MDIGQLYSFLFESYAGVGILMGAAFLIMLLAAFILERKTRRKYVDRDERSSGTSFFNDEPDNDDSTDTGDEHETTLHSS